MPEGLGRDITHPGVLAAMRDVPRHEFVPAEVQASAYGDHPLPIGHGQTISQPYIVALMTQLLDPQPDDRVLEIGTGSGYQAAVLARIVAHVYSIEIVEELARRATATFNRLAIANITVRSGNGHRGWPEEAPFDAVIVTCAPRVVPATLIDQLAEGGRMVIPVGDLEFGQELYWFEKQGGRLQQRAVLPVRFVPMTGGAADTFDAR